MRPLHDCAAPFFQQNILAIGSVLPLQIVISHTRKWWDSDARSSCDCNLLHFKYEMQALPDDWTIGGQKKGHFSAKVSHWGGGDPQALVAYKYDRQVNVQALQFSSCLNE